MSGRNGLAERKKQLRAQIKEKLGGLSPLQLRTMDEQLTQNVLELPELEQVQTVFCFYGVGREVDTKPLLKELLKRGKQVCLPLCTGPGLMEARLVSGIEGLRPGAFGIPEPDPEQCPLVLPEKIDICLVPCAAADEKGTRLGKGGGYYDRYLPKCGGIRVLLCREAELLPDIPAEPTDVRMDAAVTEKRVLFFE